MTDCSVCSKGESYNCDPHKKNRLNNKERKLCKTINGQVYCLPTHDWPLFKMCFSLLFIAIFCCCCCCCMCFVLL